MFFKFVIMKVKSRIYVNHNLMFDNGAVQFQNGVAEISKEIWKEICDKKFPNIYKEGDEPEYRTKFEDSICNEVKENYKEYEDEIARLKGIIETQKITISQKDKEIENWKSVVEGMKNSKKESENNNFKIEEESKDENNQDVDGELLRDLKSMKKDELISVAKSEDGGQYTDEDLEGKNKDEIITMGQLTFTIKYKKNSGLVFSVAEIWAMYLFGIKIDGGQGTSFSNESIRKYIEMAQKQVEKWFNLRFCKQLVDQTLPYYRQDYWQEFPILLTNYPVREPLSMIGMLNKMEQIIYPQGWLFCEYDTAMGQGKRRISVVPTGSSTTQGNAQVILTGITSQVGMQRFDNIPDYWRIQYITGWDIDDLPMDLLNIVGMLATFGPLNVAGDLVIGAGIANQSLSIDGLSQSIGTTSSAENAAYSARIKSYQTEIKETVGRIKLVYDQPKFRVF